MHDQSALGCPACLCEFSQPGIHPSRKHDVFSHMPAHCVVYYTHPLSMCTHCPPEGRAIQSSDWVEELGEFGELTLPAHDRQLCPVVVMHGIQGKDHPHALRTRLQR